MKNTKFRIWNGQEMEYNIMAGFLGAFYVQGIDENDSASMSPSNTKYDSQTPLMQFTGMLDEKGVKIWESDIVERQRFPASKVYVGKVEFDNGSFIITPKITLNPELLGRATHLKVIGNIYENPELMQNAE